MKSENDKSSFLTYVWNLKNDTNNLLRKNTCIANLWLPKGIAVEKGRVGGRYIKILCYPLGDVFDSASDPVPLPPARPPTRDNPKHGSSLNRTPSDYDLLIPPLG